MALTRRKRFIKRLPGLISLLVDKFSADLVSGGDVADELRAR